MKATIWHNPRCSKSRAALTLLEQAGAEVTVIRYLETPPTRAELARVLARAGVPPRDAMRPGAPEATDDAAALAAMVRDPALIERPIVETANGAAIARPPEPALDLL